MATTIVTIDDIDSQRIAAHGSGRAELPHPARPANHSHAPVAQCDPPLTTASTAIRRHYVDRGSGLDVPALFPYDGRLTGGSPLPSTGSGRGGPFAGFSGTMRPSDSCLFFGPGSLGSPRAYRRVPAMDSLPVRLAGNRRARVLGDRLTRGAETDGGNKQASQVPGEPQGDRADF